MIENLNEILKKIRTYNIDYEIISEINWNIKVKEILKFPIVFFFIQSIKWTLHSVVCGLLEASLYKNIIAPSYLTIPPHWNPSAIKF